jgi:hypothetical protein
LPRLTLCQQLRCLNQPLLCLRQHPLQHLWTSRLWMLRLRRLSLRPWKLHLWKLPRQNLRQHRKGRTELQPRRKTRLIRKIKFGI